MEKYKTPATLLFVMKDKCIIKLQKLTEKKYIFFVDRGNSAIKIALKYARKKYSSIYIPDQAGWMTYRQFTDKLKFEVMEIETDYGFINFLDVNCAIINSMPAYSFLLDMEEINAEFLINDISGSIGTESGKKGDLIIGSFNRWKPVDVEYGGFIATDDVSFGKFFEENFDKEIEDFYEKLYYKLEKLDEKLNFYQEKRKKVLDDLKDYEIIHREKHGINVIVQFQDLKTKEKLINYCEKENLEYTICPRDIRVLCDAISIEVKRL